MIFPVLLEVSLVYALLLDTAHCYQDGDVRLVGGSYQWEGRVEVYMSGVWGTITDSDWTNNDAVVVCRKLGHFRPGATGHSNAYFGEGKGPVNLDSVICSGSEYILTDCELQNSGLTTIHSLDVGVKCQPAYGSYREGDIRLVGGPHNWEGRVEIFWIGGVWGAISGGSSWADYNAKVVCRQLQHRNESGVAIGCCGTYGRGSGEIHIRNVLCYSVEKNITQCMYNNITASINHEQDVGVKCEQRNEAREGEIRLNWTTGTNHLWEGRVEMFHSGEWGTVCYGWASNPEAKVVCRQLGYNTYGSSYSDYGTTPSPIHLVQPGCVGPEYRLVDCANKTSYSCTQVQRWGVSCEVDGPEELDIRLSTRSYSTGYVQVFTSGSWVHVANTLSTWTVDTSKVVCRQLGYDPEGALKESGSLITLLNYTTMDNVECKGTEARLTKCHYDFHKVLTGTVIPFTVGCKHYICLDGDIRLVGGDTEREGRVEVCSGLRWGTVCDKDWTDNHTSVVCRFLGFSDLLVDIDDFSSEKYGQGVGPVFIDFINCTGLEGSLWKSCIHRTHYFGCSHADDVGVKCQPARCSDGQLRLTEGEGSNSGRVEICYTQRWQTLSTTNWIPENSIVTCYELGFQNYSINVHHYGEGGGPRYAKFYRCSGREQRLAKCISFNETSTRIQSNDIGLQCHTVNCIDGELRLMDGRKEWEGRLEVCYNKRWGTVGADGWTETNSHVVCNALGYDITDEPANQSIPMAPSKPLYYHSIRCSSRDLSLLECGFTRHTDFTKNFLHVIVRCKEPDCSDGELRLVGGLSDLEGRLEVCFNKRWGTIDGTKWTHTDTQVSCKQLGYSTTDVSYSTKERKRYGMSKDLPTFMTLVGCYGSEQNLTDCSYHDFISVSTLVTTTMDVSIACRLEMDQTDGLLSSDGVAIVALIMVVILTLVVAALIVILVLKGRKRKTAKKPVSKTEEMEEEEEQGVHYMRSTVVHNVAYAGGTATKPSKPPKPQVVLRPPGQSVEKKQIEKQKEEVQGEDIYELPQY